MHVLLKENGIHRYFIYDERHVGVGVERFNRTFKQNMDVFSANNTYRCIDILGELFKKYSTSYDWCIKMMPIHASKQRSEFGITCMAMLSVPTNWHSMLAFV